MNERNNPSVVWKTLKLYMSENLRYKKLFFGSNLAWIIGISIQKLALPLIIATTFDKIISTSKMGSVYLGLFVDKIIAYIVLMLIAQALIDIALVMLIQMETKVIESLHVRVYEHLLQQSMHFHNSSFGGSLVNQASRLVSGYITITDTLMINITQLIVMSVFSSIVLAFYSPLLAIVVLTWSALFFYTNIKLTRKRTTHSKARAAADSILTGSLADSISNIGAIKTFAEEKYEIRRHSKLAYNRARKGYVYWIISVKNDAVYGLMMGFIQLLILMLSIFLVQKNMISVGTLVLAQVYITQTIANLWGLSGIAKSVEQSLSDAAEMTQTLSQEAMVQDIKNAYTLQAKTGNIIFDNVTFTHAENNGALFKNLDLRVSAGEKVGLIGNSGGGKTTITKLLLRFMDIQEGVITIDEQDIAKVTQSSLRKAISYVPQEPMLFHRTLSENIRYGKLNATDAEVERAAKLAHAHEFIKDLPQGYETLVGERGVKLSGGQRQRVAIARAILKDAPILVLDEATSALDSESEKLIQDALGKLMKNRTSIVIAHRLSTIQKMDRIIVLDKGKIIEEGSHKELLAKNGVYTKLWKHQSGGFIEE
jgi:ATP-binding cassette subfamily B protein